LFIDTFSLAVVCAVQEVNLRYNVSIDIGVCYASIVPMYIEVQATFVDATELYSNPAGTLLAVAGYYSDGSIVRNWNGAAFIGGIDQCLVQVAVAAGVDDIDACLFSVPVNHYVDPGTTFETAINLWLDPSATSLAGASWYSDGVRAREWDGAAFIGFESIC
jgi:hypothetical protein